MTTSADKVQQHCMVSQSHSELIQRSISKLLAKLIYKIYGWSITHFNPAHGATGKSDLIFSTSKAFSESPVRCRGYKSVS